MRKNTRWDWIEVVIAGAFGLLPFFALAVALAAR